ncbi:hypothetical protein [Acidipila rosea]|uniref:Uncharacterized protein n=1 Tax=Acidipila rosea TaxID=768535 RepID=A0A4R1L3Y2_9BACT|nr:hypothetical protein [Acidipila rosea]MBW4026267.1 hypothetical protein [Acidobacteriota bacterium]MBW4044597.1 hypothetical protein [Acidobacteriota bacterium]TCK72768.1 hypothetical protein C7378_2358 [Acidipila rosea]
MNEQTVVKPIAPIARGLSEYATVPTKATVFMRTFLPWQIIRFLVINAKIMSMTRRNEKLH